MEDLNFNCVIIYVIHKMLVLLKNHLNYLKDNIFECFFKEYECFFKEYNTLFSQHIMMKSLSLKEENIIKDIRNLFRLKKELNYTAIKDIRNLLRREKETKAVRDRMLRDIKNLFELEEQEMYYKPVRVSNF